jgi:hypothetical protein
MRFLFLGHTGIGDHIIMNGLIHTFIKEHESLQELQIIAADDYRKTTLLHMYEDYPIVTFYWLRKKEGYAFDVEDPVFLALNGQQDGRIIMLDDKPYITMTFGLHSQRRFFWLESGKSWIDCLYKFPLNYDCENRYKEFHLPSNLSRAQSLYDTVCKQLHGGDYVLIHDDPTRGRNADAYTVKELLKKDNMLDIPVLYLGFRRYQYPLLEGLYNKDMGSLFECESLFDLYYLLQNAKACHLMDSSIACLVDISNIQGKLYMHNYINEASGLGFTREPWVQINKLTH